MALWIAGGIFRWCLWYLGQEGFVWTVVAFLEKRPVNPRDFSDLCLIAWIHALWSFFQNKWYSPPLTLKDSHHTGKALLSPLPPSFSGDLRNSSVLPSSNQGAGFCFLMMWSGLDGDVGEAPALPSGCWGDTDLPLVISVRDAWKQQREAVAGNGECSRKAVSCRALSVGLALSTAPQGLIPNAE